MKYFESLASSIGSAAKRSSSIFLIASSMTLNSWALPAWTPPTPQQWKAFDVVSATASQSSSSDKPLSAAGSPSQWLPMDAYTDEFNGTSLDTTKWFNGDPAFNGMKPSFFSSDSVAVKDGYLAITMRSADPPEKLKAFGYGPYAAGAIKSRQAVLYGYFEIRAKAMKSSGYSNFWFYKKSPNAWTEIDGFELCAANAEQAKVVPMTVHVFHLDAYTEKTEWSHRLKVDRPLTDDFHVYGVDWSKNSIDYYFDGRKTYSVENLHWHQPLDLMIDSEIHPGGCGIPAPSTLPSEYLVDYVRAWKHSEK